MHLRECVFCLCARLSGGIGGDDASPALATHVSISIKMSSLCLYRMCSLHVAEAMQVRLLPQNRSRAKARGHHTKKTPHERRHLSPCGWCPPTNLTPHPTPLAPAHRIPSTTRCRRGRLAPLAGALAPCGGCFRAGCSAFQSLFWRIQGLDLWPSKGLARAS
jgi:hypothetical protein